MLQLVEEARTNPATTHCGTVRYAIHAWYAQNKRVLPNLAFTKAHCFPERAKYCQPEVDRLMIPPFIEGRVTDGGPAAGRAAPTKRLHSCACGPCVELNIQLNAQE
jgi:hypothetical protein